MKKTINNLTFTALTILVLIAASAKAQLCEELKNDVYLTAQKQDELSLDGETETLADLKKKRDSFKAKAVILRGLSKLSKQYKNNLNELRTKDYTKLLSKDAKEVLKEVENRFTIAAKYTLMANAIISDRDNSADGNSEHAMNYLSEYKKAKSEGSDLEYLEFIENCHTRLDITKEQRDYVFSQDDNRIRQEVAQERFSIDKKKAEQALSCKRIKTVIKDVRDRPNSRREVNMFFTNYAYLMNGLISNEVHATPLSNKHFYQDSSRMDDLHDARSNNYFKYFNQEREISMGINQRYKGDVDIDKLNTITNNYKLLTETYSETTKHVEGLLSKGENKLSLKAIGKNLNELKCNKGEDCSPINTAKLIKTINDASKALGRDEKITEKNLLAIDHISKDYLKNLLAATNKELEEANLKGDEDIDIKAVYKNFLDNQRATNPRAKELCPEDIFKTGTYAQVNSCLSLLEKEAIKTKEENYETEADKVQAKIQKIYNSKDSGYANLEKLKIYTLAKYWRSCNEALTGITGTTLDSNGCQKKAKEKELSALEKSVGKISDRSVVDNYAKESGLENFDPSTSKGLSEIEKSICSSNSSEDFASVCKSLTGDIASMRSKEQATLKRNQLRAAKRKAAEFQDNRYYLQYDRSRSKMVKKRRPRYAVFNHALKYGAAQLNGMFSPILQTQQLRGRLFGMQTSAIFMKQQLHWQKQSMKNYYDLSNPYLSSGFYSGTTTTTPGYNFN